MLGPLLTVAAEPRDKDGKKAAPVVDDSNLLDELRSEAASRLG